MGEARGQDGMGQGRGALRAGASVEYLCVHQVLGTGQALCHSKNKQRGLGKKLTAHGLLSRRQCDCHAFGSQDERQ